MLPQACQGCPLVERNGYFTPDTIRAGSKVIVVTQHVGEQVGGLGAGLDKNLTLAGLSREDISLGSAIRCQSWGPYETPPLDKSMKAALDHCHNAHFTHPEGVRLIVAQGQLPLYALTGEKSIAEWRGWLQPLKAVKESNGERLDNDGDRSSGIYHPSHGDIPVLGVLAPSQGMIQPEKQMITRLDFGKAARYLTGKWPSKMPEIQTTPPRVWPKMAAADTEYHWTDEGAPHDIQVYRYSLATPDRRVWVVETTHVPKKIVVPTESRLVLHNAIADWGFFSRLLVPWKHVQVEDTMLLHSVLWSGLSREKEGDSRVGQGLGHGLDFLASVYGSLNRHKHLSDDEPLIYAGADALVTMDVWEGLSRELEADAGSQFVYRECVLPLVPIILEGEMRGLKINKPRVAEAAAALKRTATEAQLRAEAAVGWPLMLSSPTQVSQQLYGLEGLRLKRGRRK